MGTYVWTAIYTPASTDGNNTGAIEPTTPTEVANESVTTTLGTEGGLSLGFWSNKNGVKLETSVGTGNDLAFLSSLAKDLTATPAAPPAPATSTRLLPPI